MTATTGNDLLHGQDSNDTLKGLNGNDSIDGGAGDDILYGNGGGDLIDGGAGRDRLFGQGGNDNLDGGAGIDRLVERSDRDLTLTDTRLYARGTDRISNIEIANLAGGNSNNLIDAEMTTEIRTVLSGLGGDDTLIGGAERDTIEGNDGNDILEGGDSADTLIGGAGDDNLIGLGGDDLLNGGDGDDFFFGDAGDDTLIGHSGADVFIIESATGTDSIVDFESGVDRFAFGSALNFEDLSISAGDSLTSTIIGLKNSDRILAVVEDTSDTNITAEDFI